VSSEEPPVEGQQRQWCYYQEPSLQEWDGSFGFAPIKGWAGEVWVRVRPHILARQVASGRVR